MSEPRTTLDERFSDDTSKPTPWADTEAVIKAAEIFWLTTVRTDGRPHTTPLVAVWSEGALYFSAGPDEQKAFNLRNNSHVVMTTGCNDWDKGIDVVVEGTATLVTSEKVLLRAAEVWTHKWDGRWTYAVSGGFFHHQRGETIYEGDINVYEVTPQKIFAHAKGQFGQTRHLF
jgi:general stress protein 26